MQGKEFVTAYNPTMEPYGVSGRYDSVMQTHREWSLKIGAALCSARSQETPMSGRLLSEYDDWNMNAYGASGDALRRLKGNFEEESTAYTELHFHELNAAMIDMWQPLASEDGWGANLEKRRAIIASAQGLLSISGVRHSIQRRQIVREFGTEELFGENTPAHAPFRAFTGRMQELDAAIVLLEVARRRQELTVVPAPLQFRASPEKGLNANFLVFDTNTRQVVGVRVRPKVFRSDLEVADKERIILVDGVTDLGNVKNVRIKKGSSQERVIPWPGIIAARQVQRIKMHGRGKVVGASSSLVAPLTLQYKMEAQSLIGGTRVDFTDLSTKVGERILAKLQPETAPPGDILPE